MASTKDINADSRRTLGCDLRDLAEELEPLCDWSEFSRSTPAIWAAVRRFDVQQLSLAD